MRDASREGCGPDGVCASEWRVYPANNSVSYDRMARCVQYFAAQQAWPHQRLIANDFEEVDARARANSVDASAASQATSRSGPTTGSRNAVLACVGDPCTRLWYNASQRKAALHSIGSLLALVQPPTGHGRHAGGGCARAWGAEGLGPFSQQPRPTLRWAIWHGASCRRMSR